jgi:hypothetical protein
MARSAPDPTVDHDGDTLTALDATFLELEQQDDTELMSVSGVMVFDPLPDRGAPTVEQVCAGLAVRPQHWALADKAHHCGELGGREQLAGARAKRGHDGRACR